MAIPRNAVLTNLDHGLEAKITATTCGYRVCCSGSISPTVTLITADYDIAWSYACDFINGKWAIEIADAKSTRQVIWRDNSPAGEERKANG